MSWRQTEAVTTVRAVADQPRMVEGIVIPYGVTSLSTRQIDGSISREAFAPGAFHASVDHWMGRQDGARMAYRPEHGARPVGAVQSLEDTPAGVLFRASIFEGPAGDQYLSDVAAGFNGVSAEWGPGSAPSRTLKDGTLLHREGKLHGIAGSIAPAYDSARIALRDMEEPDMPENQNPAPEGQTEPQTEPVQNERSAAVTQTAEPTLAERSARERETVSAIRLQASITRPEAIYGPRSGQSYFADMLHAREGDGSAAERLNRHRELLLAQSELLERAGDVVSSEIPGAYPNEYLPGLLTPRIMKGRPMGGFFGRITITDAQPKIFPKVTTSTSVAVQAAEGTAPVASDLATTAVTATPLLYGGHTVVSRQVIDGADPSIDSMLMQDLVESYAQASETVIKTAVEAGASASGTAITAATPFAGTIGNIIAYQAARFQPAQAVFVPPALYAVLLAQADTAGRPLIPYVGPYNSEGAVQAGGAMANLLGAGIYLSWASTANVVVTARPADYVIYESSIASFRYDQPAGPAGIDIGIWAYLVVGTRLGGLKVTAA